MSGMLPRSHTGEWAMRCTSHENTQLAVTRSLFYIVRRMANSGSVALVEMCTSRRGTSSR
eukprot:12624990-Alexandrium_andersonii.AAC.1